MRPCPRPAGVFKQPLACSTTTPRAPSLRVPGPNTRSQHRPGAAAQDAVVLDLLDRRCQQQQETGHQEAASCSSEPDLAGLTQRLHQGAAVAATSAASALHSANLLQQTFAIQLKERITTGTSTKPSKLDSVDPSHAPGPSTPPGAQSMWPAWGALALLSVSYMHQSCNSFVLPVMLPAVSSELHLDDMQGALLTTGFSYLYAVVLLPVGMLCDRLPRPKLLAAGVVAWTTLGIAASSAHSFGELLAARIGFAAAQAVQNPISFALIPELFPTNKSAALSIYNCAVYLGRALSFGAALAGAQLARLGAIAAATGGASTSTPVAAGAVTAAAATTASAASSANAGAIVASTAAQAAQATVAAPLIFVPLDKLDLRLVSIVYTRGDYAAVLPNFSTTPVINAMEDLALLDPTAGASEALQAWFATGLSPLPHPPPLRYASALSYSTFGSAVEDFTLMDPNAGTSEAVQAVVAAAGGSSWREVLRWVAIPGFAIALALVFALPEPREAAMRQLGLAAPGNGRGGTIQERKSMGERFRELWRRQESPARERLQLAVREQVERRRPNLGSGFVKLLRTPVFMTTALAASFNDVASYALVAWQSTFYERVYHLEPSQYAPILAVILPLGGIIGGVGGGWVADATLARENRNGGRGLGQMSQRVWVTAGASIASVPMLLISMLTPDVNQSYLALLLGFALSEAWRAPAANMATSVAPPDMGSSASALYLCIRNLVGGVGPLGVAFLTQYLDGDLQHSLLLVPAMYLLSGIAFWVAEQQFARGPDGDAMRSYDG